MDALPTHMDADDPRIVAHEASSIAKCDTQTHRLTDTQIHKRLPKRRRPKSAVLSERFAEYPFAVVALINACGKRQLAAEHQGNTDFILSISDACIDVFRDSSRTDRRMYVFRWLCGTEAKPGRLVRDGWLTIVRRGRRGRDSRIATVYQMTKAGRKVWYEAYREYFDV